MNRDDPYSNPFDDGSDVNPFAQAAQIRPNPVMQQAPAIAPSVQRSDFNPFADTTPARVASPVYQPAPVMAAPIQPAGPSAREMELERRLAEMEAREKKLQADGVIEKPKNWPPCYPLVRHSIEEDIKDAYAARLVKFGYLAYLLHCGCLLLNMVGALAILVCPTDPAGTVDTSAGSNFGIAVVFFALGIPLSWVFWYRPFYNAAVDDRAAMYLIFLCMFGANICFVAILIIGIEAGGTVGFIEMLHVFSIGKIPAGIICIVGMVAWGAELGLDIFLIIRVYLHFRGRGGTDRVKQEAAGGVASFAASNPQVLAGVARGAAGAASNAV